MWTSVSSQRGELPPPSPHERPLSVLTVCRALVRLTPNHTPASLSLAVASTVSLYRSTGFVSKEVFPKKCFQRYLFSVALYL
jgi:hypothetical protein